jgi:hypothetical protein
MVVVMKELPVAQEAAVCDAAVLDALRLLVSVK